jgi:hypothetical protein
MVILVAIFVFHLNRERETKSAVALSGYRHRETLLSDFDSNAMACAQTLAGVARLAVESLKFAGCATCTHISGDAKTFVQHDTAMRAVNTLQLVGR